MSICCWALLGVTIVDDGGQRKAHEDGVEEGGHPQW
jgi:hypothetical protein